MGSDSTKSFSFSKMVSKFFVLTIDKKLFTYLAIGFIVATVIGTLSHEFGHFIVAEFFGYDAHIAYDYTWWTNPSSSPKNYSSDNFWITLGGPFETMMTGTIGFAMILLFRKTFQTALSLSFLQWVIIFIALFWLRQSANLVVEIGYRFKGHLSIQGDEIKLARYLQIPDWSISLLTAVIGVVILAIIIFKFIPNQQRLTFILSGLVGGILGYVLWLHVFGHLLMP
jgi:hypothetical protein